MPGTPLPDASCCSSHSLIRCGPKSAGYRSHRHLHRGVWLAERLHRALGPQTPCGTLEVCLRDDYEKIGLHRDVKRSHIPFEVDGRHLVLVDDVLYTGRTITRSDDELFDYGRPASIRLAALDRSRRARTADRRAISGRDGDAAAGGERGAPARRNGPPAALDWQGRGLRPCGSIP